MVLGMSDFNAAYSQAPTSVPADSYHTPKCEVDKGCFAASHVTPNDGTFLINTYLARPDRKYQPAGAVAIREGTLCRNK